MNYFKSAVAFFFLFFLHGTSIGNGQQGISYNAYGLAKWGNYTHKSRLELLWLNGLPKLVPTEEVEGRDQRIWKLPPSEDRAKLRSKTYQGIAQAMAAQWTKYLQHG